MSTIKLVVISSYEDIINPGMENIIIKLDCPIRQISFSSKERTILAIDELGKGLEIKMDDVLSNYYISYIENKGIMVYCTILSDILYLLNSDNVLYSKSNGECKTFRIPSSKKVIAC